jgi:hypothetical protein
MHLATPQQKKMCLAPVNINGIDVACRRCWQCNQKRIDDVVGQCIAERMYSGTTLAVTLTYADKEHVEWNIYEEDIKPVMHTISIYYKDFQDFLKRLRKRYKVRFICAGEYGTHKGRAHFHCILFFKEKLNIEKYYENFKKRVEKTKYPVSIHATPQRFVWEYWKQGIAYFQHTDGYKGFQYVLKYTLKDQDSESSHSTYSLTKGTRTKEKPNEPSILGYEFFEDMAERYIKSGIVPKDFYYKFDDIKRKGKRISFEMNKTAKKIFLDRYMKLFFEKYGHDNVNSTAITEQLDKYVKFDFDEQRESKLIKEKVFSYDNYKKIENPEWMLSTKVTIGEYEKIPCVIFEYAGETEIYTEGSGLWQEKDEKVLERVRRELVIMRQQNYVDFLQDQFQSSQEH